MTLLLKIVVGCVIAIALVICLAVLAFVFSIRKFFKNCLTDDGVPLSIHLHEDLAPEWIQSKDASELITGFTSLGFTQGNAYWIDEMSNVRLISLFNEQYAGVVYEVTDLGCFFDIMQMATDGTSLTVSTLPFGDALEQAPEKEKLFVDDLSVSDAFQLIQEKRGLLDSIVPTNENFRMMVEKFYKDDMGYKNRNGGVSRDEFNELASREKKRYSEEQLNQAFLALKSTELDSWRDAGVEEYYETNAVSDEERYEGGCLLFVPSKTDPEAFLHYLSDYDLVQEEHIDKLVDGVRQESNILTLFEKINNARSPDLRAIEVGDISFPVEAKIYQLAA